MLQDGLWIYEEAQGVPVITYQWQADNAGDGNFVDLAGATADEFTPGPAESGDDARVIETATTSAGARSVASPAVSIAATPTVFTPDQINGLARWWDASGSDFTVSGSDVLTWNGFGDHALTPVQSDPPVAATTTFPQLVPDALNARPMVLVPLGAEKGALAFTPPAAIAGSANRAVIGVVRDVANNAALFGLSGTSAADFERLTLKARNVDARLEIESGSYTSNLNVPTSGALIMGMRQSGPTLADATIYVDGVAEAASGTQVLATDVATGCVARNSHFNTGSNGGGSLLIGELLIFETDVSLADWQSCEGYLAHKWGLAAQLPVGHPHRDAAP
jgi:hypothetical protein